MSSSSAATPGPAPRFEGKGGDDTVCVESGGASVDGDSGNDWISAERAREGVTLDGGAGEDTLIGSRYTDHVYLSDGDDVVRAGGGRDFITLATDLAVTDGHDIRGGSGKDEMSFWGFQAPAMTVRMDNGTVRTEQGRLARFQGVNKYIINGSGHVTGSDKADNIHVSGAISLNAGGGNDRIDVETTGAVHAGSGDDQVEIEQGSNRFGTVKLGPGDDTVTLWSGKKGTIRGGSGDDRFQLKVRDDNPDDDSYPYTGATFLGQSGKDTLAWRCKATVNAAKERLRCAKDRAKISFGGMQAYQGGKRKDTFRGSSRGDVFHGGAGKDTMYGKKGRDTLIGGKGYDIAHGGKGKDSCRAEKKYSC